MSPLDAITLKAFLAALSQINSPLPAEFQQQLRELGTAPFNFEKMHELGTQPPLAPFYESAWDMLLLPAAERTKSSERVHLPQGDDSNGELTNVLDGLERQKNQTLEEMMEEACNRINDREPPKDIIIPIFKRWML